MDNLETKMLRLLQEGPKTVAHLAQATCVDKRTANQCLYKLPKEKVMKIKEQPPTWKLTEYQEKNLNRKENPSGQATSSTGSCASESSQQSGVISGVISEQREILAVLRHNPVALPPRQIAKALGLQTKKDVNSNLYKLLERGLVVQATKDPPTWKSTAAASDIYSSFFKEFFTALGTLGKGAFGKVLKAEHKLDKQIYAVKMIEVEEDEEAAVTQEVITLAKLEHQNIVQYKTSWIDQDYFDWDDVFEGASDNKYDNSPGKILKGAEVQLAEGSNDDVSGGRKGMSKKNQPGDQDQVHGLDQDFRDITIKWENDQSSQCTPGVKNLRHILCIQMELCDMSLQQKLAERSSDITVSWNKHVFTRIVDGLEYIHRQNIAHNDLASRNVFLCNTEANFLKVKIGDFGLTRGSGTGAYREPEPGSIRMFETGVDMFSLVVIFCELFCCFRSETERENELKKIRTDSRQSQAKVKAIFARRHDLNGTEAVEMVLSCLGDQFQRPSCTTLKQQLSRVWQE